MRPHRTSGTETSPEMPITESHSIQGSVRLSLDAIWGRRAPCAAKGPHRSDFPPLTRLRGPTSERRRASDENALVSAVVNQSKIALNPPRPPETKSMSDRPPGESSATTSDRKGLLRGEEHLVALVVREPVQFGRPDSPKVAAHAHEARSTTSSMPRVVATCGCVPCHRRRAPLIGEVQCS